MNKILEIANNLYSLEFKDYKQLEDYGLKRWYHGYFHACIVAHATEITMLWLNKYFGYNFSKKTIEIMKIVALGHDWGRLGEEEDLWEKMSAEKCKIVLMEHCGMSEIEATTWSNHIIHKKDNDIYDWIIKTADALHVIRTRGLQIFHDGKNPCKEYGYFDINRLYPAKISTNNKQAYDEFVKIADAFHSITIEFMDKDFPGYVTIDEKKVFESICKHFNLKKYFIKCRDLSDDIKKWDRDNIYFFRQFYENDEFKDLTTINAISKESGINISSHEELKKWMNRLDRCYDVTYRIKTLGIDPVAIYNKLYEICMNKIYGK